MRESERLGPRRVSPIPLRSLFSSEVEPLTHSITSSARGSSDGGTVRPSERRHAAGSLPSQVKLAFPRANTYPLGLKRRQRWTTRRF
jgi:hypothetical protein